MRKILVILGICLMIPNMVFGIDKSWKGKWESNNTEYQCSILIENGEYGDGELSLFCTNELSIVFNPLKNNGNTLYGKEVSNNSNSINVTKTGNSVKVSININSGEFYICHNERGKRKCYTVSYSNKMIRDFVNTINKMKWVKE